MPSSNRDVDLLYLAYHALQAYDPGERTVVLVDRVFQTRGYVERDQSGIVVAISGTKSLRDLVVDASVLQEHERGGMVHGGFWREYEAIRRPILDFVKQTRELRVRVTGHSLGAALATYAAEDIATMGRRTRLVTFGSPRPGNAEFCAGVDLRVDEIVRVVHGYDLVTRVPKLDAAHTSGELRLSSDGMNMMDPPAWKIALMDLFGKSLRDHRMRRYVAAVSKYRKFV